jgi:cell division protein FtsZ
MTHLKEEAGVMMFEFAEDSQRFGTDRLADIKVVGVGGAGGNAVGRMIEAGLVGVEFFAVNTDLQALHDSPAHRTLQIGAVRTKGLGSGGDPQVGRAAAEEDLEQLREALAGADMVFVTAGMGGGTGTGAAPVIAQVAREVGALTVGIVTKPFRFEAAVRMQQALAGIEELRRSVDTLIIIPNQRLLEVVPPGTSMREAFRIADNVLYEATRGIYEIISRHDHVNLDFADVRTVMKDMGQAMMGTGRAEGPNRAVEAARQAISSPLLENVDIRGSRAVLVNVLGREVGLQDTAEAMEFIQEAAGPQAHVIFGYGNDESMGDMLQLTVIATGFAATRGAETDAAIARLAAATVAGPMEPVGDDETAAAAAARVDAADEPIVPADLFDSDQAAWAAGEPEVVYVADDEVDEVDEVDLDDEDALALADAEAADDDLAAAAAAEEAAREAAEREAQEREAQELLELEAQLRALEEEEALAAEEARLAAEAAEREAEEARLAAEAEAERLRVEEELRLQAAEEARLAAEEQARERAAYEARVREELEVQVRLELAAQLREEHEARLREEFARERAGLEARERAEQEAREQAEWEARERAELEAREQEAREQAEQEELARAAHAEWDEQAERETLRAAAVLPDPEPLLSAHEAAAATVEPWSLRKAMRSVQPLASQVVTGFLSRDAVAGGEPRTPARVDLTPPPAAAERPAASAGAGRFLTPVGTRSLGEVEVPDGTAMPLPVTRSAAAGLGPDHPNADLSAPAYTRKYMD